jgi:hypothetical protein
MLIRAGFVLRGDRPPAFLWSAFGRGYIMAVMDFGAFAGTSPLSGRRTASAGGVIDLRLCHVLVRLRNRNIELHGTMPADSHLAPVRAELSSPRSAFASGMRTPRSRWSQCLAQLTCALATVSWSAQAADALVVTTTTEDTTQAPQVSTDPWFGVPWNNVAGGGSRNFVYLGNGWCLSASHVGPAPWEPFQSLGFGPTYQSYNIIPGQNFLVPNPSGSGLSTYTDLRLVRIDGDPGLPAVTIASQPLTSSNLGQAVADVTIVGLGSTRQDNTDLWNGHLGYYGMGDYTKRWGRNQISNEDPIFGGSDTDLRGKVTVFVGKDVNANVDIMSMVTLFDLNGVAYESQAIGGDSGSSVFHKNASGQWELIGIVNAVYSTYSTQQNPQPANFAAFGVAPNGTYTLFADLTYYRNEIINIMNAHATVLPGDYNNDGVVDNADYIVWRKGLGTMFAPNGYDVWRAHFGETAAGVGSALTASGSLSSGALGVPEPSGLVLALGAAGVFLFYIRRRLHQFV